MFAKLKTVVFGLCAFVSIHCVAQTDSVKTLNEVIIEQSRLNNYAISQYIRPVDSVTRALASGGSLADLLRKFGYGNIRSYGPGGLATASLRGSGSSHTAVLWNGINLLSPLNGTLDLSLVPVGFIDDVSIQSGGSASLYGNGSIGGTIQLNNTASFNEGLKLRSFTNGGSFGTFYQDIGASWSGKKFITSTKVFYSEAKNDFEFTNRNYSPARTEKRDHSGYEQKGILQQAYWQISAKNLVHLKFWYQDNFHDIPNTTFSSAKAKATQEDKYYRTLLGWNYSGNGFDLSYQGAFIRHDLEYLDSAINNLVSSSNFNTSINNFEANFLLKNNMSLTTGANYTWEEGQVANYGSSIPERNRIAIVSAFKWNPGRLEIAASFRQEFVDKSAKPFSPGITGKFKATKSLETYISVSRNYRIPTFNDLYWRQPGFTGDPNLKTETSFSSEAGFTWHTPKAASKQASLKVAAFSNQVDNWILWAPTGSSGWSPQNIKNVWSRGIEAQGSVSTQVDKVNFDFSGQYSLTLSTNESIADGGNSNELGKQLMFTPIHQGSVSIRVIWQGINLNIINSVTGKQYTDSDNSEFFSMKPNNVLNAWLSRPFQIKHLKTTISAELNNALNTEYQSRPGYPMPGRSFKIGLTLNFNKLNSI